MMFQIKAKLTDGRTVSGPADAPNAAVAFGSSLESLKIGPEQVQRATIVALSGSNVKVRAPKKKAGTASSDAAVPATRSTPAPGRAR